VPDVSYIDSGVPPDDMHDLSIADAIGQRRPALVVFATPAFCTSRMCGPEVHAVQQLEPAYRARIVFIHVEIYQDFKPDPSKMRLTPTVLEWRLQSEPWVFLIDGNGIVRYACEGPAATDELRAALDELLAQR
jgi:peroxiredoxin